MERLDRWSDGTRRVGYPSGIVLGTEVGLVTLIFLWFWPRGVLPERRRIIPLPGLQQARTRLPRPVGYEKTAETR